MCVYVGGSHIQEFNYYLSFIGTAFNTRGETLILVGGAECAQNNILGNGLHTSFQPPVLHLKELCLCTQEYPYTTVQCSIMHLLKPDHALVYSVSH